MIEQELNNQRSLTSEQQPAFPIVNESGLSSADVAHQIARGHVNVAKSVTSRSTAAIIRSNVFTLFNAIIVTAMIVVLLTGSWRDAVFGFVIIINTGIGIFTELRAKHTLDKLSILVASKSTVRRDNRNVAVDHGDIVLNDLLWIAAGDQIPADGTVLHSWGGEVDESMLTGESVAVGKREDDEVYSGSIMVAGMALVKVNAVGANSYAAELTAKTKVFTKTISDLNRGINTILKYLTFIVVPLCALLVWSQITSVGGWHEALATGSWRQAIIAATAGVVGMIPEGLVLLTSLNFAIAAMRLARVNTLVQELESVETLARVDCLNLDKTGTITNGAIALRQLYILDDVIAVTHVGESSSIAPADSSSIVQEHSGMVAKDSSSKINDKTASMIAQAVYHLANEAHPNATGQAVLDAFAEQTVDFQAPSDDVEERIPFSSARKWSAVQWQGAMWYMGAPEVILSALDGDFGSVENQVRQYASQGQRVLVVACTDAANSETGDNVCDESEVIGSTGDASGSTSNNQGKSNTESNVTTTANSEPTLIPSAKPCALIVCAEQIREDAHDTLAWFREQGVRCRIISGDSPTTVGAIARQVQLTGSKEPQVMDARQLPKDTQELADVLERVDVLGRVLPEQKQQIVKALQSRRHVVAMTGDGVNDVLALKSADLGIAMGNAAPATKAVSQVVLVDSQFSHLPQVVARGCQVMANMERVAGLFLVKTVYSIVVALGVVCAAMPYPYLPRHITFVGSLTIGIPAFILSLAPNTRRYIPGFLKRVLNFAIPKGLAVAASVLLALWVLPILLRWDMSDPSHRPVLRTVIASMLFWLGLVILAFAARPLRSWRGVLVAACAIAGVVGVLIPWVATFFAIHLPDASSFLSVLGADVVALLMLLVFQLVANTVIKVDSTQ